MIIIKGEGWSPSGNPRTGNAIKLIYWQFLEKRGSSNLAEQIAVLRPVIRLLKRYEIVIVGDR